MKIELMIKKKNIYTGILLFILSGYIYAIYGQAIERVLLAAAFFVMLPGLIRIRLVKEFNLLEILYMFFLISFFMCAIIYVSIKPLIYGGAMLLVLLMSRPVQDKLDRNRYNSFVFKVNYFIILAIYAMSFITKPIAAGGYEGIFSNPNALGILAGMGAVLSANDIIKGFYGLNRVKIVYVAIFLTSLFVLMISSCRSALLGVGCSLALMAAVYLMNQKVTKKKIWVIMLLPVSVSSIFIGIIATGKFDVFFGSFIKKFSILSERGDLMNGRDEIWNIIYSEAKLFQNGIGKVQSTGTPSHNVYLGLADSFGIVVGLLFFVFMMVLLYKTAVFSYRARSEELRFYPVTTAIYFFCISMFENYLMTYVMIMMFLGMDFMNHVIGRYKTKRLAAEKNGS